MRLGKSQFVGRGTRSDRVLVSGFSLLIVAMALAPAVRPWPAHAAPPYQIDQNGYWSVVDSVKWDTTGTAGATHMVVLRGNGDSTRVLHFHDQYDPRLWLWTPAQDTMSPSVAVRNPQDRVFCAGQVVLRDGRALVVGGTTQGETGSGHVNLFDPKAYGPSTWGWTKQDSLKYGRWYPSATVVGGGQALVMSGHHHFNVIAFGGADTSGAPLSDIPRLMLLRTGSGWNATPPMTAAPVARQGHVAAYDPMRAYMLMWGGRGSDGGTDALVTIWQLRRTDTDYGERWEWKALGAGLDDATCGCRPAPRADAASVLMGDSLVIYGGRRMTGGATAEVLGDVWRLRLSDLRWEKIVPQAGGPGARYDAAAGMDPGQQVASSPVPQLIVHGGHVLGGGLANGAVWALPLPRAGSTGSPMWSQIAAGGPESRAGHTAILDPNRVSGYTGRYGELPRVDLLFFGGLGASGLKDDLWSLTRTDTSAVPGVEGWAWRLFVAGRGTADSTSRPAPRSGHSATYDREFDRLLVFAGVTPSGLANNTWAISMNYSFQEDSLPKWGQVAADSAPSARAGHTAVFEDLAVYARLPERFTAAVPLPQSQVLGYAQKRLPFYPHFYLLKSGKLFFTGNRVDSSSTGPSYVLDLNNTTQPWQDQRLSGFIGGASAMFRPDSVMKSGGGNGTPSAVKTTKWVPAGTTLPWKSSAAMDMKLPRANHNLTILPTGQVLATGGTDANEVTQYMAEIWTRNPGAEVVTWDTLAADPFMRRYHSTAVLLPDARVLVSGGPTRSSTRASIFWPPYLFANSSGALRTRPQIAAGCHFNAPIGYGDTLRVDYTPASDAIGNVCLIRPGATTHQFDMNQRYAPLSILGSGSGYVTVLVPPDTNVAPAGDHMLFIVRTDGTPSVAKWVRLQPDATPPGQTTNLAEYLTGLTFIDLTWTAPGDDAALGKATQYDLRYSLSPITTGNFNSATQITHAPPQCAGETDQNHKAGLLPCTTYYFALKTKDGAGNWSVMSNVVAITTECLGEGLMASGWGPEGWQVENLLLGEAEGSETQTDMYRLNRSLVPSEGQYRLRLSQPDLLKTLVEGVELVVVEHDPATEAFAVGERIVLGSRTPASTAASKGADILSSVDGTSATGWVGHPGDTLEVGFGEVLDDSALLVIESSTQGGSSAESSGIEVRALDPAQGWVTRGHFRPRGAFDAFLLDGLRSDQVQLVLHGVFAVRYVGVVRLSPEIPKIEPLPLTSAKLADGDVADLLAPGGASLTLFNGSEVELAFAAPSSEVKGRDQFLTVRGSWTRLPAAPGLRSRADGAAIPRVFALHPARPNPARGIVRFEFDVPRSARVTVEVFDLQGRRVRTLVRGERSPGTYELEWDRRDEAGNRLGPGVYLYRMEAERYRARRKLVVLP